MVICPLVRDCQIGRAANYTVDITEFSKPANKPVLGIETSCDETGVALLRWEPAAPGRGLLAHTLYSQIKLHADYGGVVPELASAQAAAADP